MSDADDPGDAVSHAVHITHRNDLLLIILIKIYVLCKKSNE